MGVSAATALFGVGAASTAAYMATAFVVNMAISMVIAKVFAPDVPGAGQQAAQQNPGSRQQLPPSGSNKLPVVYGSAYVGGVVVDMSITSDNQDLYWAIALSEVTNTETGGTPDYFTFGNIYWGGKLVLFDTNGYSVIGLRDESTGLTQDIPLGNMDIWLYRNGSNQPVNSTSSAITIMSNAALVYKWDAAKLYSNCAFAIVHIKYNSSLGLTGLQATRFSVINPRNSAGDCISDYMTSTRYGAALPSAAVDSASLAALNAYSNGLFTFTPSGGGTSTQSRFKFNGTLDTNQKIMQNLQSMADCCDCLIKYNEVSGTWCVIVQTPTYSVVMDINDSNTIGAITVNPSDISNSFNQIETKFPDGTSQDSFNVATLDLALVNPSLLYPNEPINKQSFALMLCNNSVQAQYLANRILEGAREDLQVSCEIDFSGLQLEAGDIVTLTNARYGWTAKLFRVIKVTQKFADTGVVSASLALSEYNPAVYDDRPITEFAPSPNTGIGSPTSFGTMYAPTVTTALPTITNPAFSVTCITASAGITQYAEIWYSAYASPTDAQRIFAGTTEINASGNPYGASATMPAVQLFNIPSGDWYFFSRMVNSLATSAFSSASTVLHWRPTTFQFVNQYVSVAYASDAVGTGFSLSPRGMLYYGLCDQISSTPSLNVADYKWYLANPAFGSNIYLVYSNRTGRKFSFDGDYAVLAGGSGAFVPSTLAKFDPTVWAALADGINIINLDVATGQVIQTGTTTVGTGQIKIGNTSDGKLVASLDQFLNFGGASTYTGTPASLTIDIYGRVVGFTTPDNFYFTDDTFTATSGQTVFTPTARQAGYIVGQSLIFKNGLLLDKSEYTETSTTFTLSVGATVGDVIACISMRAVSTAAYYENLNITVSSSATNTITWNAVSMPFQLINAGDLITFANTGTPTQYTVSAVNYTTRVITFTTNPTVSAGATVYRYRAASASYPCISRWNTALTSATAYTPSSFQINSGAELLFLNGTVVNDQDYNIVGNTVTNFPATTTGNLTIIQFAMSNLSTPVGTPVNVLAFTQAGIATYSFPFTAHAFDLWANGVELGAPADYTEGSGHYTFTTTPTNNTTALFQQTFARVGAA